MSEFTALVKAQLDSSTLSSIKSEIQKLGDTQIKLKNITISDTGAFTKAIQSALDGAGIKIDSSKVDFSGVQNAAKNAAQNINGSFQNVLKSIDLVNGGISNVSRMLQGAGFNNSAIKTITQDLAKMSIEVQKVSTTMNGGNIKMNIQGVDELGRAVTVVREYSAETGKVANTSKTFTQSFQTAAQAAAQLAKEEQQAAIGASKAQSLFSTMQTWLNNNSEAAEQFGGRIKELQSNLDMLKGSNVREINEQFKAVKSDAQAAVVATSGFAKQAREAAEQTTKIRSATLSNQMETWMQKNTAAAAQYGDKLRELQNQLKNNTDSSKLTQIRAEFGRIKSEAQSAGLTTNTFVQSLKNIALQTIGITGVAMAIRKVASEVKEAINTVVELDTQLVDLQKTTTMSGSELAEFYFDANEAAKELGVTTKEIIETAATWSRLGFQTKEEVTTMSKLAAQFEAISPGMSMQESSDTLVSVIKAFGVEVDDVLDGIMSKINVVGKYIAHAA